MARIKTMIQAKLDINLMAQISNLTVEEIQLIIEEMDEDTTDENL